MTSTTRVSVGGPGASSQEPSRETQVTGWRRWGAYVALTVVFATACVGLGVWQFERRAEVVARIELITENYDSSPIPLSQALPRLDVSPQDLEWHPVRVTGHYDAAQQVLVRNRSSEAGPGFEILTPLITADGTIFAVDRGWVDRDAQGLPTANVPEPPSGTVTVEARLRASEPSVVGQSASGNLVPTITLPELAKRWDAPTYTGAYGIMRSESPASPAGAPLAKPSTSEGNHLSYAFQWLAFAILGVVALVWAIRRERRLGRGTKSTKTGKSARRVADAEIEDSIVDGQS